MGNNGKFRPLLTKQRGQTVRGLSRMITKYDKREGERIDGVFRTYIHLNKVDYIVEVSPGSPKEINGEQVETAWLSFTNVAQFNNRSNSPHKLY